MSIISLADYEADQDCPELIDAYDFTLVSDDVEETDDFEDYMNLIFN